MTLSLSTKAHVLYEKLHVSRIDIFTAIFCVDTIIKNKRHNMPWERRGSIYKQQSIYMTALVVSYARPFTRSEGWPALPADLLGFSIDERELHDSILKLRNKVYAHSDSASYSIRPVMIGEIVTAIEGLPILRFTADQATLFREMATNHCLSITSRLRLLSSNAGERPST